MKKINFKFSKRQAVLITAFIALLGVSIWSVGTLSAFSSKSPQNALGHVTEPIPIATTDTISKDAPAVTSKVAVSDPQPAPVVPAPVSLYEKYGVSETTVQAFANYYPDYAAYNNELFIQYVATINPKILDTHVKATGLLSVDQANYKSAEKDSFMRLLIANSNLSITPWITAL